MAESSSELGSNSRPALARHTQLCNRPRSRGQVSVPRPTPSSPLVYCIDVNNSPRSSLEERPSFEHSEDSESHDSRKDKKGPLNITPVVQHNLKATYGQPDPIMLSPPMSPPSLQEPSPPLTSPIWTPGSNTTKSLGHDAAIVTSTTCQTLQEYIETLMLLDLKSRELLRKIREELENLYGIKKDPIQLILESLYQRRQALLAEWGVDHKTCLDDRSLERFSRRCEILDIDNQVRVLELPQ
ncbi:MAG: hypothetical protein Q9191_003983 [Dirinaria sp. TL-2023a]